MNNRLQTIVGINVEINRLKLIFALLPLLLIANAKAGAAGGPYLLWVNLSNNDNITQIVNKKLEEGEVCSRPDMQIFPVPNWISRDLINKAVIHGDKDSISALDTLIRKEYPEYTKKGLDGIIVYSETPKPQLSNFVRGRKLIAKLPLKDPNNEQAAWRIFCSMVPPVTRPS